MGNLADHRRLREAKGLYKEDPGTGHYTKQELDYIPFLGNNPSDEKPAVYTARFNVTNGVIARHIGFVEFINQYFASVCSNSYIFKTNVLNI